MDSVVQYFDEMNLIEEDKKNRIDNCKQLSKEIANMLMLVRIGTIGYTEFKRQLSVLFVGLNVASGLWSEKLLYDNRWWILNLFGIPVGFNKESKSVDTGITASELHEGIARIVEDVANICYTTESNIDKEYFTSSKRAEEIAKDQVNKSHNSAEHMKAKKNGYAYHKWVSFSDGRERPDHLEANGQVKPIDEPFIVGGYKMSYPTDTTYGAPANETCGCRCIEKFLAKSTHSK